MPCASHLTTLSLETCGPVAPLVSGTSVNKTAMRAQLYVILACGLLSAGCEGIWTWGSFQECVVSKVSTASDQQVAHMLREACAKKYQNEMPESALKNFDSSAGHNTFGGFVIQINNRNEDWIITEVEFYVSKNGEDSIKPYLQSVYIEPLSKDFFSPSIDNRPKEGASYSWGVLKAWGVPSER